MDTYRDTRFGIDLKDSLGTTVRPQFCNERRFSFINPRNASLSIFAIILSDNTLKKIKKKRLIGKFCIHNICMFRNLK